MQFKYILLKNLNQIFFSPSIILKLATKCDYLPSSDILHELVLRVHANTHKKKSPSKNALVQIIYEVAKFMYKRPL